jgi:hypothetical protein
MESGAGFCLAGILFGRNLVSVTAKTFHIKFTLQRNFINFVLKCSLQRYCCNKLYYCSTERYSFPLTLTGQTMLV